jgi:hypothetical protein
MKARLRKAPDLAALEAGYEAAAAAVFSGAAAAGASTPSSSAPVVLSAMDSRELAGPRAEVRAVTNTRRGRERGLVEDNADGMTLDDMVREERRTRGGAGEGVRLAERIARDAKFADGLDYMEDNAEKLARRVHRTDAQLKSIAVGEYQRLSRALDACPLCFGEEGQGGGAASRPPLAPVVALGTRVFLTLAPPPELSPLGAVIVPLAHRASLLECDDDEWEEMRNFMKALTRMHHDAGRDVVFYESATARQRKQHRHACMTAVSIPYDDGATVPAYFREAFLSSDDEWSQHRQVIDTAKAARDGMGRMAFRRSFAKEAPYFHAWFSLDGGLGHVVENEDKWPKGDRFAREVLGGMMDVPVDVVKKNPRWGGEDRLREAEFRKRFARFDWTRVLHEEG